MPLPELTVLSGVGFPSRRRPRSRTRRRSRVRMSRSFFGGGRPKSRMFVSLGNLGLFESRKGRCHGVNLALQHNVGRGKCKTIGRRNVCRSNAGRAFIKKDVKGRMHFENGHFRPIGGMSGLYGNFGGIKGMAKRRSRKGRRRTIRQSKGQTFASLLKLGRGKCRRSKRYGGRTICKTSGGRGYIRRDVRNRLHSTSGNGRFSINGMGGLGGFGGFGGGSLGMPRFTGRRRSRRSYRRGGRRRGYLSGLSSSLGLPDVKKILPIDKNSMIRTAKIAAGAIVPITIQNMVIPKKWRFGIKGLLSYAVVGGGIVMGTNRFARSSAADVGTGVVLGLFFQLLQNYVFKKPLIPVVPTKPVAAPLSGLGDISDLGCATCANAGHCGDIGDCVGYVDELEDDLVISDDLEDDDLEGLYADDENARPPRPPRRRPRRPRRPLRPRRHSLSGLNDYLMRDLDNEDSW